MPFHAALETLYTSIVGGDPVHATPLVRVKTRLSAAAQIAIYSDAYRIRLRHATLCDYPCLAQHMGENEIRKWIDAYVRTTPSLSYNLDFYPFGFWRFLQNNQCQPALGELAELEGAIAEVFMTPGSAPLTAQDLPPLDEAALAQTKFQLRTPFRLLRFTHDVEAAMVAFKRGEPPAAMIRRDIFLFLYRHNNEVQRRYLDKGAYHLLDALHTTAHFDAALQQAIRITGCSEEEMAKHLPQWLGCWIGEGFLSKP